MYYFMLCIYSNSKIHSRGVRFIKDGASYYHVVSDRGICGTHELCSFLDETVLFVPQEI